MTDGNSKPIAMARWQLQADYDGKMTTPSPSRLQWQGGNSKSKPITMTRWQLQVQADYDGNLWQLQANCDGNLWQLQGRLQRQLRCS
jgi:hypothetical protein